VLLDQGPGGQNDALAYLLHRNAVVQVAQRELLDEIGVDRPAEALAGILDQGRERGEIERAGHAVLDHVDGELRGAGALRLLLPGALAGPLLAVEHVGARDLVLSAAHQRQLDLVLDILDVEGAPGGLPAHERLHDVAGKPGDQFTYARGSRTLAAVDGDERLGHGHRDLRRFESHHRTVAAYDLVLRIPLLLCGRIVCKVGAHNGGRRNAGGYLHIVSLDSCCRPAVTIAPRTIVSHH